MDWEQLEFWTKRAFRRLSELGVEVVWASTAASSPCRRASSRDEATEQACASAIFWPTTQNSTA
ncbi:MAG: hypothetical protein R2856_26875 [Caldilineaceae bacterium]